MPRTVTYSWEFGDGATATTKEPFAEHSFADRKQEDLESSFVVAVRAKGELGELEGFGAVTIANAAFQNRALAKVVSVDATPHDLARDGATFSAKLDLFNHDRETVRFARAVVRPADCSGQNPNGASYEVDAREILDKVEIAPGRTTATLSLRGRLAPEDACRVLIDVAGKANDGLAAIATIGVPLRAREPTRVIAADAAANDPANAAMARKLAKAFAILGRQGPDARISESELRELERKGLLDP